jgi:hypothetical protein
MLIAITEANAWENERWTYVLDIEKQDSGALNDLMIFFRLANEDYDVAKEDAGNNPMYHSIFNRHQPRIFAASKYWFKFCESMVVEKYGFALKHKTSPIMHVRNNGGYKSGGIFLDKVISPKRAKSAMIAIRDRQENILYKDFESIFLSSQKKKLGQQVKP